MNEATPKVIDGMRIRAMLFDPNVPDFAFLTKSEVCAAFDTSDRTLRDLKTKGFPEPIQDLPGTNFSIAAIREYLKRSSRNALKTTKERLK